MRRALATNDAIRVNADVPLVTDVTELITMEVAEKYLNRNKSNRPVNWKEVEDHAGKMKRGEFELIAQGIVFDKDGNLLTGQTRLWAVLLSGCSVYMRVSRGWPSSTGRLLDRGRPQSARDLATRQTEKKHAPTEASIARGICGIRGMIKPSKDELADVIAHNSEMVKAILKDTAGMKKNKSILMVLAAICCVARDIEEARRLVIHTPVLADKLDMLLLPHTTSGCWGRGAGFGLALQHAMNCVQDLRA